MMKLFRREDGSALVFTAMFLVVLLGFGALAVDISMMYTAKNQLQAAVDAAALAGGSALTLSQGEANSRATAFASANRCLGSSVTPITVTFPTAVRIRVDATRNANLFLAGVLGINTGQVTAHAAAELSGLVGVEGVRPWAIPDIEYDAWDGTGSPTIVTLKSGDSQSGDPGIQSSFFYPAAFPPVDRLQIYEDICPCPGDADTGGATYRDNIINGIQYSIFYGDTFLSEPGNMIGPTMQGVRDLINMGVEEVIVPLYKYKDGDGNIIDYDSGRKPYEISDFGIFHLLEVQGQDVVGYFVERTIPGFSGPPNPNSSVTTLRLVE